MASDNTELYLSFQPDGSVSDLKLTDIHCWMKDHHLQHKLVKTELLLVSAKPTLPHNYSIQL